jgi:hypothetical protein
MTCGRWLVAAGVAAFVVALAPSAFAQSGRTAAAEGIVGYAGFIDDATIHHSVLGGAARWYLLPRVAVGPELVYMKGPGDDRDVVLTGNVTFDLLSRTRAVTPFLVVGGGIFRHSDRFGGETFSSTEGSFTGGGGVRIPIGERLYVAPEFRIGWEPHYRLSVAVGWRFGDWGYRNQQQRRAGHTPAGRLVVLLLIRLFQQTPRCCDQPV